MANEEEQICAHDPCACTVSEGEKYCSDYCRNAGSEEVEIACECDHEGCQYKKDELSISPMQDAEPVC